MARSFGCTRTNYFSVTDPERLKEIVFGLVADSGMELFEQNNQYGFGCYGIIHGLQSEQDDDDLSYDVMFDDMCRELQNILVDGDAIIIAEACADGLRDICG